MKKIVPNHAIWLKVMRISFTQALLMLLFVGITYATDSKAQLLDKRVSIEAANREISVVLQRLEKLAKVKFVFSPQVINAHQKISVHFKEESFGTVLDKILRPLNIKYEVSGQYILLSDATAAIQLLSPRNIEMVVPPIDIAISGVVKDENGVGLPGVNVVLKGTQRGTTSNIEGRFNIDVPNNKAILVFSFVGYLPQEVAVGNQTQLNVGLKIDNKALNEVVVVGYGTVKRRDLTGAVVSIGTNELKEQPISSFNQALQGRVSGVQITNSSNAPGGGITVRVRGGNSISASNDPLYVIDGFPIANPSPASGAGNSAIFANPLASINPNDIESIEVLKDASSTAIYGSRGANGVVLVTTKRGKSGQSNIDFEVYYGSQEITKMLDLVTAEQHTEAKNEQLRNLGFAERYGNSTAYPKKPVEYGVGTNWQKEIYRVAPMQSYQLSFSGGTDKLRYAISGNYFNQDGIVITTNFKRYNARLNLDAQITNKLKIGTNFSLTRSYNNSVNEIGSNGIVGAAVNVSPASPIFDANGNYQLLNVGSGSGFGSFSNPVAVANTSTNLLISDRVIGNLFADISILEGLSARINVGADIFNTRRNIFYTPQTLIANSLNGYGSNGTSNNLNLLNENTLTYTKTIQNHAFDVVAGITFQSNREERTYAEAQDFPNYTLGANNIGLANKPLPATGSVQEWGLNSYLGRVNYRLKDRYLLTLTGRIDGSSRFGDNNKYGFFPSGALAWRVSDEDFLKNSKAISDLKLRVSYGITGNDGIGLYSSLSSYGTGRTVFGDTEVLTTTASRIANPDLRWEKTGQFDVGFDLGLLNNRIQLTGDYYVKTTSDLLLGVELPATTGFTSVTRNVGSLENRGFELSLNTVNIDKVFK